MDSEFDRRWRATEAPFDGVTVALKGFTPLTDLRKVLVVMVDVLHAHHPDVPLLGLRDWHEHDGFLTEAHPSSWGELRSLLASEAALRGASAGDTYVRTAFFPEGRDFLLRLYVPDDYDNPFHDYDDPSLVPYGVFDVTCPEPLVLRVRGAAQGAGADVQVTPAKAFFDANYSG